MTRATVGTAFVILVFAGQAFSAEPAKPSQLLEQQRQVQQQARDLARQLVGEVLDVQLEQFRDNKLTGHPWYAEIQSMRNHLDDMVGKQMSEVLVILQKADLNDPAERLKAFQAARQKSREVLVRIQVEEQVLLRRLKIMELARQIQQLIDHQNKVYATTQTLPQQPAESRQEINLSALEDQRDVTATYTQFKKNLLTATRFSGEVGRDAAATVALADKQQIETLLSRAETGLHAGDFPAAADSQRETIASFEALLKRIRSLEKSLDPESLAAKIAEALKKEEQLRTESANKPLDPDTAEKLAEEQTKLAEKIAQLAENSKPAVQAALEKAKKEAEAAAADLFEQKQPDALAQESKATDDLKAAERQAEKADANQPQSQNAEDAKRKELENKIDQLAAAAEKLDRAAETERNVAQDAQKADAKADENSAENKADKKASAKEDLKQQNAEAAETAKSAQNDIKDSVPEANKDVDKALEENKNADQDLNRAEQANKDEAAKPDAAKSDKAKSDSRKPQTGDKAQDQANADDKKSDADKAKSDASNEAAKAAKDLDKAAKEVRKEAQKAADELAQLSKSEADKVADLQKKVDNEIAKADQPTTDQLQALANAAKKVDDALKHQDQADKEAQAKADKNNQDAKKSDAEKNAAKEDSGKENDGQKDGDKPDAQGQVSDEAKEAAALADAAAPDAAKTLEQAGQQSDNAKKNQAQGSPKKAAADRAQTKQSLAQAKKELNNAQQKLAAQAAKQLAEEAKDSSGLAQEAKPLDQGAEQALQNAKNQAEQGSGSNAPSPGDAAGAQEAVRESLAEAAAALAAKQDQIAGELAQGEGKAQGDLNGKGDPNGQQPGDKQGKPNGQQAGNKPGKQNGQDPGNDPGQPSSESAKSSQGAKHVAPGGGETKIEADMARLRDEPWFAKLPPETRDAIRANAQRRPPPGYENQTKEYFENIDP